MAREAHVVLVDDVDGSDATETIRFGLDGIVYEIDLNAHHADMLRNTLEGWTGRGRRSSRRVGSGAASSRAKTKRVRQWARENGYSVPDRGPVRANIRQAYAKSS